MGNFLHKEFDSLKAAKNLKERDDIKNKQIEERRDLAKKNCIKGCKKHGSSRSFTC